MPCYTMRLTWHDRASPNDFIFRCDGRDVGRCYFYRAPNGRDVWLWFVSHTSLKGMETTLVEAQAKFKAAYEASEEFGKPSPKQEKP